MSCPCTRLSMQLPGFCFEETRARADLDRLPSGLGTADLVVVAREGQLSLVQQAQGCCSPGLSCVLDSLQRSTSLHIAGLLISDAVASRSPREDEPGEGLANPMIAHSTSLLQKLPKFRHRSSTAPPTYQASLSAFLPDSAVEHRWGYSILRLARPCQRPRQPESQHWQRLADELPLIQHGRRYSDTPDMPPADFAVLAGRSSYSAKWRPARSRPCL